MLGIHIKSLSPRRYIAYASLVSVLAGASVALAQKVPDAPAAPSPQLVPPIDLSDPTNIEAGREMFNATCTHYCHGREARGGGMRGPPLRNLTYDDTYIYVRIAGGKPPMPAFAIAYRPEQIWKIIAYLRSLKD
jgi:mono/diheme cytochrome c family protein